MGSGPPYSAGPCRLLFPPPPPIIQKLANPRPGAWAGRVSARAAEIRVRGRGGMPAWSPAERRPAPRPCGAKPPHSLQGFHADAHAAMRDQSAPGPGAVFEHALCPRAVRLCGASGLWFGLQLNQAVIQQRMLVSHVLYHAVSHCVVSVLAKQYPAPAALVTAPLLR